MLIVNQLMKSPASEPGLLSGVARTTSKARIRALATIAVAALDAVTIAADRSRTLNDSGGRDLMRVLLEGMVNDQGVAP